MDRFEVFRRLNLENDVLPALSRCANGTGGVRCFDQIVDIFGSIGAAEDETEFYRKVKVVTELEAIAGACPRTRDQFCAARLILSNIMGCTAPPTLK